MRTPFFSRINSVYVQKLPTKTNAPKKKKGSLSLGNIIRAKTRNMSERWATGDCVFQATDLGMESKFTNSFVPVSLYFFPFFSLV